MGAPFGDWERESSFLVFLRVCCASEDVALCRPINNTCGTLIDIV
jgi:hypothetical protein